MTAKYNPKRLSYTDIKSAIEQAEAAVSMREVKESQTLLLRIVKEQQETIDALYRERKHENNV